MSVLSETFVQNVETFRNCCEILQESSVIGLDTEFVGEDRFRPDLCLVQLSTASHLFVIDPFPIADLSPMWDIITQPDKIILVHAGREELRICHFACGKTPEQIFDVQIAAGLLGFGFPAGYSGLIQKILKQRLSKAETLTDWRRRPLAPQQIRYAYDDVRYLIPLWKSISNRLKRKKRHEWAKEEFADFRQYSLETPEEAEKWRKLRGLGNMTRKQLAMVRAVFEWRDQKAERINRPAKHLLRDDLIIEIVRRNPHQEEDMNTLRGLGKNDFAGILAALNQARELPPQKHPKSVERDNDPPQVAMISSILSAVLNDICMKEKMTPGMVATTADLKQLIRYKMKNKPLPEDLVLNIGWRKEAYLPKLLEILDGKKFFRLINLGSKSPFEYADSPSLDIIADPSPTKS